MNHSHIELSRVFEFVPLKTNHPYPHYVQNASAHLPSLSPPHLPHASHHTIMYNM